MSSGLDGEKHDEGIHTLMIRVTRLPGPPFDPLDLPLGDSSLSRRNPNAQGCVTTHYAEPDH
jgi:hypothetical protein